MIDTAMLIKAMAKELLRDYGHAAYESFCQANPGSRWQEYEDRRAEATRLRVEYEENILGTMVERELEIINRHLWLPRLCGPWGRL